MKRPRTRFAYASASYSTVTWRLGYMRRTHYHLPAGRGGEAIPLHKRTLADRERVLGADHPHTLTTRNNLAATYQSAGRLGEAIPLYERTLADSGRVLGADHLRTLSSRANLERARAMAVRPRSRRDSIPVLQSGFVS